MWWNVGECRRVRLRSEKKNKFLVDFSLSHPTLPFFTRTHVHLVRWIRGYLVYNRRWYWSCQYPPSKNLHVRCWSARLSHLIVVWSRCRMIESVFVLLSQSCEFDCNSTDPSPHTLHLTIRERVCRVSVSPRSTSVQVGVWCYRRHGSIYVCCTSLFLTDVRQSLRDERIVFGVTILVGFKVRW